MGNECERSWQVDAVREGRLGAKDAESFERHRRTCPSCAGRMAQNERLRDLVRALPDDEPTELALRRLRTRVMRDVATGVVPRERSIGSRVAVAVFAAAAVGAGLWALAPHGGVPTTSADAPVAATNAPAPSVAEPLAGVVSGSAARWAQTRDEQVERVRLDDGTIDVHVRAQVQGERFLVLLPDGEIEVRGTTFQVTVAEGTTSRVHVDEGVVELRLHGAPVRRLGASETWTRGPTVQPVVHSPARTAAPSLAPPAEVPVKAATVPSAAVDDGTSAYSAAMQILRSGDNAEAAAAFHAFVVAHPGSPMAEDASFLEAVALARAGRADAAGLAAEHHLASFPGSFHRKDAAVLVARAAAGRGDCDKARTALAPWAASADAEVRAALRPCAHAE